MLIQLPNTQVRSRKSLGNKTSVSSIISLVPTAVALRKTWLLHKQIKNRATLAYKNSVRKCYQGSFFIANMQFNNPTSMPQT